MPKPPALRPAEAERATVSLRELRAVLDRLSEAAPERAGLIRAIWEDLLVVVEAKARSRRPPADDGDEGIDYSDLPPLGDDDAYWTGGRIGPVLPGEAPGRAG
jgi:hypothetical protein